MGVFSLEVFKPKVGEITVVNAVERIAYSTQSKPADVFRGIAVASGIAFVFIWVFFLVNYIENTTQRFILLVLGVMAPFIQNFFGHVEIYGPFFPAVTGYLMVMLLYLRTKNKKLGWLLIFLLFLCLKFHFASVLLIPSFILTFVYVRGAEKWRKLFTWKKALQYFILPVFVVGWIAYFFVFKDHNDPRFLDGVVKDAERLFLPIFTPEAPLDNYNLFSFNHILDYFNNTMNWAGAGLFVLIVLLLKRKKFDWNRPEIILLGLSLILFFSFFFMVNPLLSMPMDWDLFSLSAPLLLFFIAAVFVNAKEDLISLSGPVLALSLMTVPIVMTNATPEASSKRLEAVGKHTFKTYWIRSAGTIHHGIAMRKEGYVDRLKKVIRELAPFAHESGDVEYANLAWRVGKYYRNIEQHDEALEWYLMAKEYSGNELTYTLNLMDLYYRLGRFDEAFAESEILVAKEFPNKLRSLAMGIDCGFKAKQFETVLNYCDLYLKIEPDDEYVQGVKSDLQMGSTDSEAVVGLKLIKKMETAFRAGNYIDAHSLAEELVELKFPNYQKALRIAIHCALEANMYDKAKDHCQAFIEENPNDGLINQVMERLEEGTDLDQIKNVFSAN